MVRCICSGCKNQYCLYFLTCTRRIQTGVTGVSGGCDVWSELLALDLCIRLVLGKQKSKCMLLKTPAQLLAPSGQGRGARDWSSLVPGGEILPFGDERRHRNHAITEHKMPKVKLHTFGIDFLFIMSAKLFSGKADGERYDVFRIKIFYLKRKGCILQNNNI